VTITADGGVRTGFDVIKMLALGADFVMVGREMIRAAIGGGAEGVRIEMDFLAKDLRRAMIMTGCNSLADINERIFA
jgi:isopentenyl diphosphate isomerase/L-lactate dehydrogenase-like FMN-dependent dehydrogenase